MVLWRKHRHIVETVDSFLSSSSIPSEFWGETALTRVNLINRISSSITSSVSFWKTIRVYSWLFFLQSLWLYLFCPSPHIKHIKYSHTLSFVFFLVMVKGKRDIVVLIQLHKNYMYLVMLFILAYTFLFYSINYYS